MTFFSRLYRYRQSEFRNACEDYLTELLAEWLRLATEAGMLGEVLEGIFGYCEDSIGDTSTLATVRWDTQHIIGPGYGDATGKRPDLVGSGKNFFLIIENKVSAGFTSYESEETGEVKHQLPLYQAYRDSRPERYGGVAFITYTTDPPACWFGPVSYWSRVFNVMRRCYRKGNPDSAFNYIGLKVTQHMKEIGMAGTHFELSDIVVLPAYERLHQGMTQLGSIAKRELSQSLVAINSTTDGFPLQHAHLGELTPPTFFGAALSYEGQKASASSLLVWAGVLSKTCYDISPASEGLPELSIGFGVWGDSIDFVGPDEALISQLELSIPSGTDGKWAWHVDTQAYNGAPIYIFSTRLTFIDIFGMTNGKDWDETAQMFFKVRSQELLGALSSSQLSDDESFIERLNRLVS
ncbi:PDDEXK family nuclease [Pseudomonas saxonica]|uniref:PD-(D/E)XK nuclease family protein n=1 Tax=Pseudomonas saxonica TaxID=2600598 RepID=A0A5C5PR25_9PSED|nr:hypothetical protein [Pseudomonas saxonica]TWR82456.1 hypothetical protein FJD37_21935 [Pseudomonas saxonica]